MKAYTVLLKDGMHVRHDAQARITVKTGARVLEDRLTPVDSIGGAMTLASVTYNRASMSGGVDWWDPGTGRPISRPKVLVRLRADDVLTGGQLCHCPACEEEAA